MSCVSARVFAWKPLRNQNLVQAPHPLVLNGSEQKSRKSAEMPVWLNAGRQ